jgi:hypothetical protein
MRRFSALTEGGATVLPQSITADMLDRNGLERSGETAADRREAA